MKNVLIVSGIVLVLILGAVSVFQMNRNDEVGEVSSEETGVELQNEVDVVIRITSEGGYKFHKEGVENPDIFVSSGQRVRIDFVNNDFMPHDLVIDEFNAATQIINQGQTTSVEFLADRIGTFEYYCSVGNHRAQGMAGNFIVQ